MANNPYELWDQQLRAGRFTSVTEYYEEGLPDREMILLVQDLRRKGIVTTESCSGHIVEPFGERYDGYLFLRPNTCRIMVSSELDIFTRVMKQLYPMPQRYELWWSPDSNLHNVREAIRKCVVE